MTAAIVIRDVGDAKREKTSHAASRASVGPPVTYVRHLRASDTATTAAVAVADVTGLTVYDKD